MRHDAAMNDSNSGDSFGQSLYYYRALLRTTSSFPVIYAMKEFESFPQTAIEPDAIRHIRLFFYLVPIFGFFPAVWTLYQRAGGRQERALSRFVIKLSAGWLLMYALMGASAMNAESMPLALLLTASFMTSGYFGLNIFLMVRLWQRKAIDLPIIGKVGRLP
jgi:hypothetical protein